MFTITAENLGPLAKGTVELKPLTIFVGPSNTGKSYMATAIWSFIKGFEGHYLGPFGGRIGPERRYRQFRSRYTIGRNREVPGQDTVILNSLKNWVSKSSEPLAESASVEGLNLPADVRATLEQSIRESIGAISSNVVDQLRHVHGENSDFARNGDVEDFRLTIRRESPLLNMRIVLANQYIPSPDVDIPSFGLPSVLREYAQLRVDPAHIEEIALEIFRNLESSAFDSVLQGFPNGTFYLPAARSGIAQGHKVLTAALVRRSYRVGLDPINLPTLPGITAEFLGNLISLDRRMLRHGRPRRELRSTISFIENEVLHGVIDLDESGGLPTPDLVYMPTVAQTGAEKFTLDHTSSMVSELAPLILFLKYLVNPGDLLILEEPESHLHPAAQRQMARGIVRLVNAGVKVLITTHSDFFVGAVNNLLRFSFADDAELARFGLQREDCLGHDEVAAYNFIPGVSGAGSVIEQLPIRKDVGIDDAEFGKVVNDLYEQTTAAQRIPIK